MKKKRKKKPPVEFLLAPRLRYMGYCLLLFSLCFFIYALNSPFSKQELPSQMPEEELSAFVELSPHDTFNFFAVSALFGAIGATCLITSKKKLQSFHKRKSKYPKNK